MHHKIYPWPQPCIFQVFGQRKPYKKKKKKELKHIRWPKISRDTFQIVFFVTENRIYNNNINDYSDNENDDNAYDKHNKNDNDDDHDDGNDD